MHKHTRTHALLRGCCLRDMMEVYKPAMHTPMHKTTPCACAPCAHAVVRSAAMWWTLNRHVTDDVEVCRTLNALRAEAHAGREGGEAECGDLPLLEKWVAGGGLCLDWSAADVCCGLCRGCQAHVAVLCWCGVVRCGVGW